MSFFLLLVSLAFAGPTFKFHQPQEPSSLDPHRLRNPSGNFILNNLHRNLFFFDDEKGLVPDLGESCQRKKNILTCKLKKNLKWSNGTPLVAQDFVAAYTRLLNPELKLVRADLLFPIRNAVEIYSGSKKPASLGVKAPNEHTLEFDLVQASPDFEYNLASTALAPFRDFLYTGPYRLKSWDKGERILLENNPHFHFQSERPLVEIRFIEEDNVALQLYEKGQLDFLRRLPTFYIPKLKSRPDFVRYPVIRFDYIGFGPRLKEHEDIRKALTYSLNYVELQKIFSSDGRPGCVGLPPEWYPNNEAPCFDFDLKKVPKLKDPPHLAMIFSALGGDDHKRATEWLQAQWKQNAKVKVKLEPKDNKVFLQILGASAPAIFRKGVTPDRPTCYSSLETFSNSNPENYIRLADPEYTAILKEWEKPLTKAEEQKLCLTTTEYLMKHHLIIPLGFIHFSVLVKPEYTGWKFNQMNQLDLSNLRHRPKL